MTTAAIASSSISTPADGSAEATRAERIHPATAHSPPITT